MRAWIEVDGAGREFLSRAGEGTVVSVTPVGVVDPGNEHTFYLVEIDCQHDQTAMRVRVRAQVQVQDELLSIARCAFDDGVDVVWAVQWHRHEWVPGHLPIVSLDLSTDAAGRLVELRRSAVQADIPEHVPASWGRLGS